MLNMTKGLGTRPKLAEQAQQPKARASSRARARARAGARARARAHCPSDELVAMKADWLLAQPNLNSLPRDPIPFSFVPSLNTKAHHYSNELGAALAAACTDGAPTRVLQLLAAGAAPGWRRAIPDGSEGGCGGEVGGEERRTCIEQARACGQWGCAALLDQAQAAIFGLAAPDESEM